MGTITTTTGSSLVFNGPATINGAGNVAANTATVSNVATLIGGTLAAGTTLALGADGSATLTLPPGKQLTFVASTTLFSGDVRVTGEATAGYGTGDSVTLQRHTHGGVQTGGGSTSAPTPGT